MSNAANSSLQKPPKLGQLAPERQVTPNCPLPAFELAQYVKEGAQKTMAGAWSCGDLTKQELEKIDCGSYANVKGRIPQWSGVINTLGKDLFFQGLMANSAQRATCDANLIYTYATDQNKKNRLNAATEAAFQKISAELQSLTQKKAEIESLNSALDHDPRYSTSAMGFHLRAEAKQNNQAEIEKINQRMTKLVLQVPMGHDPDVAQALIAMGSSGKFDAQKFYNAMISAQAKYIDTAKYFQDKFVPFSNGQGQYCYGADLMNTLGKTGEIDRWMQTSVPSKTREDKLTHDKMQCYMKPYTIGQERLNTGMAIVGFASLFIPGAGEGVAATKAIARGFSALRAAGGVGLVLGLNSLREKCFTPEIALNSSSSAQCDPVAQMETMINRRPTAECAVGGALVLAGGSAVALSRTQTLTKIKNFLVGRGKTSRLPCISDNQKRIQSLWMSTAWADAPCFSMTPQLESQFDELVGIDDWLKSSQVQKVMTPEELSRYQSHVDVALDRLNEQQSAERVLTGLRQVKSDYEGGVGTFSREYRIVRNLKPNEEISDIKPPGVSSVKMSKEVVNFLQENRNAATDYVKAIEKGFVNGEGATGITRRAGINPHFISVKVVGNQGQYRLLGCIEKGEIILLTIDRKGGQRSYGNNTYKNLCPP